MKRLGRWVLILLLLEMVLVFALGVRMRRQVDAASRYIGLGAPRAPLDVGHPGARVLEPGQGEEQVG